MPRISFESNTAPYHSVVRNVFEATVDSRTESALFSLAIDHVSRIASRFIARLCLFSRPLYEKLLNISELPARCFERFIETITDTWEDPRLRLIRKLTSMPQAQRLVGFADDVGMLMAWSQIVNMKPNPGDDQTQLSAELVVAIKELLHPLLIFCL